MSEAEKVSLPPVPRVDIARVLKLRDRLAAFLTAAERVDRPAGAEFAALVKGVDRILPNSVPGRVLVDMLTPLAGAPGTPEAAVALAWRIAANVDRLKTGRVVLHDTWTTEAHWAAVQITSVRPLVVFPDDKEKRQTGGHINLAVLAGLSAPLAFRKFWSRDMFRYAGGQLGFSAPWGKTPQSDEREFVNFRMFVYIDPAMVRDGRPNFRHLFVTPSMYQWNRDLIKMRTRDQFPCPRRYPLEQPCYSCPAGMDECPAACHALSFVGRPCPKCGRAAAWFDPDPNGPHPEICASCGRAVDLNKKK